MIPARRFPRPATMADIEALPPGTRGEIIDGVLYTQPRPRSRHATAVSILDDELFGPFHRGRGGPVTGPKDVALGIRCPRLAGRRCYRGETEEGSTRRMLAVTYRVERVE